MLMPMLHPLRARSLLGLVAAAWALAVGCGGGGGGSPTPAPPSRAWTGFGGNGRHTALSDVPMQDLTRVRWTRPVDLYPTYTGDVLYVHYGSPLVTQANTVIFPVKTGALGGFRLDAVAGASGASRWTMPTDYQLPPHGWIPSLSACLTPARRLYVPAGGGTLLVRDDADAAASPTTRIAFYGDAAYASDSAAFDGSVFVNTPLTSDEDGNVYFGVQVIGANPAGVASCLVKITPAGVVDLGPDRRRTPPTCGR